MKNKQKKIIILSGKQFSGKDTVAKILLEDFNIKNNFNFKRIGIADAIKLKYSLQTGLNVEEIEKNKSLYRKDLIDLGNWGRAQNPDYWLNSIIDYSGNVIVTDIRVRHEFDLFKEFGAFAVRIEASESTRALRGKLVSSNDTTETQLDIVKNWDYVIENNASYNELVIKTKELINYLEKNYLYI